MKKWKAKGAHKRSCSCQQPIVCGQSNIGFVVKIPIASLIGNHCLFDISGNFVRSIGNCETDQSSAYATRMLPSLSIPSFEEDAVDHDDHTQDIHGRTLTQRPPKTPKTAVNYFDHSKPSFLHEDPLATFLDVSPTPFLETSSAASPAASGGRCEDVEDDVEMEMSFEVPNTPSSGSIDTGRAEEVHDLSPAITPFSGGIDALAADVAEVPEEAPFCCCAVLDRTISQELLTPPERPQDFCLSPPRIFQHWRKMETVPPPPPPSSFSLPSPTPIWRCKNYDVEQVVEDAIGAHSKKCGYNANMEDRDGDDLSPYKQAAAEAEKENMTSRRPSDCNSLHHLCIPPLSKRNPESLLPDSEDLQSSGSVKAGRATKSSLHLLPRPTDDFETMMKEMSNMFGSLPQPGLKKHCCGNDNDQNFSIIKNSNMGLIDKDASTGLDYTTKDLPSLSLKSICFSKLNFGIDTDMQDHLSPPRIPTASLTRSSSVVKRIPARRVSYEVPAAAMLPAVQDDMVYSSSNLGMLLVAASCTSHNRYERVKGRLVKDPQHPALLPVEEKPKESAFNLDGQNVDEPCPAEEDLWRWGGPQSAQVFTAIEENLPLDHDDHQTWSAGHGISGKRGNWQTARADTSTTVPSKTVSPPVPIVNTTGNSPHSLESISSTAVFAADASVPPVVGAEMTKRKANEAVKPPAITLHQKERAPIDRLRPEQKEHWMHQLQEATEFRERRGHCCIPCRYPENQELATWAKRQRYMYHVLNNKDGNSASKQTSTLTAERVRLLENIGFCWDVQTAKWFAQFEELRSYISKNGANFPQKDKPRNKKLFNWIKRQRRQFNLWKSGSHSQMNEERAKLLESIPDFTWWSNKKRKPLHCSGPHLEEGEVQASLPLKKRKKERSSGSTP